MEQATGQQVAAAAEDAANFAKRNDARMAENLSTTPAISRVANTIKGYVMEQRDESKDADASGDMRVRTEVQALAIGIPVIVLLIAWRRRSGRAR
jgi:hypothetical protein